MKDPFDIDFSKKTDAELDALSENWIKRGHVAEAQKPLLEKARRGTLVRRQKARITWNVERADQELKRFVEISEKVPDNLRAHLKTGGKCLTGEYAVDRYTAIKNEIVHAHMACHIE